MEYAPRLQFCSTSWHSWNSTPLLPAPRSAENFEAGFFFQKWKLKRTTGVNGVEGRDQEGEWGQTIMIDDNCFLAMSFYLSFLLSSSSRFLKSICRILGVEKKDIQAQYAGTSGLTNVIAAFWHRRSVINWQSLLSLLGAFASKSRTSMSRLCQATGIEVLTSLYCS